MRTQVAIIGSGPSGLLLEQLLAKQGIDNDNPERVSAEHVLGRIRAGILEQEFVDLVHEAGVGDRMDREGELHDSVQISVIGVVTHIDLKSLTGGKCVICYGQTEITRDLMEAREKSGLPTYYEANDVERPDVKHDRSFVTFENNGKTYRLARGS